MKYTQDKNRILFSKKVETLIEPILEHIRQMKWSEYSYKGPCHLMNGETDEFEKVMIEAKLNSHPYVIIGGAVYFIYKQVYPDVGYMDPTGDVDIHLDIPKVLSINDKSDMRTLSNYYISTLKDKTLNELSLHYMNWLLDNVYDLFEVDDLEAYEYTTESIITRTKNNKLYFSIVQEPNMIKLQVECKVKGTDSPDHLLEMVLIANDEFCDGWDKKSVFYKGIQEFNGFPIQTYNKLIEHNMQSIEARFELANDPSAKHKLYNHIGRVRYLNYIYQPSMNDDIKRLLYFLWVNRVKIYDYNYERTMDNKEFMHSMVGNFYKDLDSKGSFVVIGKGRTIKTINTIYLIEMYKPLFSKRGRTLFKSRFTRKRSARSNRPKIRSRTVS